ncbi:MAG: hypothetical protein K6F53_05620 [Lachnospiraceae bacterium]|nr:hypothetical protein [Lachnospiraceae bacterium]
MFWLTRAKLFFQKLGSGFSDAKKRVYKAFNLKKKNYAAADRILAVAGFFILALFVELTLFNFRHWQSVGNREFTPNILLGSGYTDNGDGTYTTGEGEYQIELINIGAKVKTAYVEIRNADWNGESYEAPVRISFDAKDTSHYQYSYLNSRQITPSEPRSEYLTFHLYGEAKDLKLYPYVGADRRLLINIRLNPVIPVFFEWARVLIVFFFAVFVYFFRPASPLHGILYLKTDKKVRYGMMIAFFLINALILHKVNGLNDFYQGEYGVNTEQYQRLAEAFKAGSLSLLFEPDERLVKMENPYDMSYRASIMEFDDYRFDHAYYNGKYYVYFGVVPCALLYFPYYLLTGKHIHNHTVCYIGVLFIIAGFLLLFDRLIRRYAKKCSVALWFLTIELTLLGSYIIYVTKRPDLYSVPIIWATAFAVLGMWAYLCAIPDEKDIVKRKEKEKGKKKKKNGKKAGDTRHLKQGFLILGSILTALVAGCRPQLFLIVILDIILLRDYCFSWDYLKSRDGIASVLSVGAPMAVIGGLLMTYNALRFGSPFDFGAFYNLTFNDMRNRGVVWDRVPLGAVIYLIRPMELLPEYPYFGNISVPNMYMGETIWETTYGGIFWSSPFCLFAFLPFFRRKKMIKQQRTLYLLSVWSILIAVVIMIFDTINSGILARYFFNFCFLWMFAASFAVWILLAEGNIRKTVFRAVIWLLVCLTLFETVYQILVFMLDSGDYLKGNRADLFWHYYYLFGFGL